MAEPGEEYGEGVQHRDGADGDDDEGGGPGAAPSPVPEAPPPYKNGMIIEPPPPPPPPPAAAAAPPATVVVERKQQLVLDDDDIELFDRIHDSDMPVVPQQSPSPPPSAAAAASPPPALRPRPAVSGITVAVIPNMDDMKAAEFDVSFSSPEKASAPAAAAAAPAPAAALDDEDDRLAEEAYQLLNPRRVAPRPPRRSSSRNEILSSPAARQSEARQKMLLPPPPVVGRHNRGVSAPPGPQQQQPPPPPRVQPAPPDGPVPDYVRVQQAQERAQQQQQQQQLRHRAASMSMPRSGGGGGDGGRGGGRGGGGGGGAGADEFARPRRTLSSVGRAKETLLQTLCSMGFPANHVRQALLHVNATLPDAIDRVINWMDVNPMSTQLQVENVEMLLAPLVGMGFSRLSAKAALERCGNSVDAAIEWLIAEQARVASEREERERVIRARERDEEAKRLQRKAMLDRRIEEEMMNLRVAPQVLSYGVYVHLLPRARDDDDNDDDDDNNNGGDCDGDGCRYMISVSGLQQLETRAAGTVDERDQVLAKSREAEFQLCNPHNFDDTTTVLTAGQKVALRCSDQSFVGVEANGEVHSNRMEFGPLMEWTIRLADDRDATSLLVPDSVVAFESPLHNFLRMSTDVDDRGECYARDAELAPAAMWRMRFAHLPMSVASPCADASPAANLLSASSPSAAAVADLFRLPQLPIVDRMHDDTDAKSLWAQLRATFRLRALMCQQQYVHELEEAVDTKRKALARRKDEERTCVVCWDAAPNTVLLPCGHICVCNECGGDGGLKACPICRAVVAECVEMLR